MKTRSEADTTIVRLTPHMIAVFVEHNRVIKRVLSKRHGLTATEFCILRALYLSGGTVVGTDFAAFLNLKRNSISTALSKLEARGFIAKETSATDRRVVVVTETQRGIQATRDATADIYDALVNSFWRGLDLEDKLGGNRTAALVLEQLRGKAAPRVGELAEGNTPITPEFVVFCNAVPQRWTHELSAFGLSLTEYRMLAQLKSHDGPIGASVLARALFLDRSVISSFKDALEEKGLIGLVPSDADRRIFDISCTQAGSELEEQAHRALQEATDFCYGLCDANLICQINDWHERMFANMNVFNALI